MSELEFDYELDRAERSDILGEAVRTVAGLRAELGEAGSEPDPAADAAKRLLGQLDREVAEFSAYPDVVQLREQHFEKRDLPVPVQFRELAAENRFYWLRFPITLSPAEHFPFTKLECAVEFNPGVGEGHLRPRAQTILPNQKFKQLLQYNESLEVKIGANFEFEAAADPIAVELPGAGGSVGGGIDAKAAAGSGLIAGPFTYNLKRAQLTHSPTGSEKVFWRLDGAEFFHEDAPEFVVVVQVPGAVENLKVAAAMRAYHSFSIAAAGLSGAIAYFTERVANFFRKGAPAADSTVWDVTRDL